MQGMVVTVVTTAPACTSWCCTGTGMVFSNPLASWDSAQFINKQVEASNDPISWQGASSLAWSLELCLGRGSMGCRQDTVTGPVFELQRLLGDR